MLLLTSNDLHLDLSWWIPGFLETLVFEYVKVGLSQLEWLVWLQVDFLGILGINYKVDLLSYLV